MSGRPSRAEQLAADRHLQQQRLARAAASVADEAWSNVDPNDIARSWAAALGRPTAAVTGAQHMAAEGVDAYVGEVLAAQGVQAGAAGYVAPSSLAGIAADGRPLESLLYQPAIRTLQAIGAGAPTGGALTVGRLSLDMIVRTQVADAGRAATGVAIAGQPYVGYIRHISPGACSRCTVLAGRFFRWNAGFQRHPNCRCVHVPTVAAKADSVGRSPRGYFDALTVAEQDRIFTLAGARAIRDGADMGRIVNARSGMQVAGRSGTRGSTQRRLTPEEIYRRSRGDRQVALRLLRQNGYLVAQPTRLTHVTARRP